MVCNEAKAFLLSLSLKNINFILKNGLSFARMDAVLFVLQSAFLQFPSDLSRLECCLESAQAKDSRPNGVRFKHSEALNLPESPKHSKRTPSLQLRPTRGKRESLKSE